MVRPARACGAIVAPEADKIEAVSKVSTWQKLGIVARVAGRQAGRSRTLNAILNAVRATTHSVGHAAHQLWLEVTGTLFLAIALFGAGALVHEYTKYEKGQTTAGRVVVAVCFTVTFAWFGVTSFLRVRRKRQHP